jgi:hydrogenase maturation protease
MKNNTIIVGIGHPFRGDDSLGPKAIAQLQPLLPNKIDSKSILGDVSELLDIFENYTNVFIVDAIFTQVSPPGTLYRLEGSDLKQLSNCCRTSTHAFDISQALEIAANLESLPSKLVIYGIEGRDFSHSENLSSDVAAQLPMLLKDLLNEILIAA